MSKKIFLKDDGPIKLNDSDHLIFEKGWVHVKREYIKDRFRIEISIPASNIKTIEEET